MRVGSLFSGYGGLDMAVGGDLAWYAEVEPAACRVMEAHFPGVPNLGDVTTVDWAEVEPVDVITGGYPCQPFSNAGQRRGTNDERHLWPYVRDALRAIRPRAAVLENVRGHLTLGFAAVLADLADLGMSARWGVVRAADAGAPHNRARLFILAYADGQGLQGRNVSTTTLGAEGLRERTADSNSAASTTNSSGERHGSRQGPRGVAGMGSASEGSRWTACTAWQEPGAGGAESPAHTQGAEWRTTQSDHLQANGSSEPGERTRWGDYAPAIARWQRVIGRPAPAPTIQRGDRARLSPAFVEWMMGLPEGWVTGHGLSASQELKMLGNGVVPQQAALALRLLGAP
jgi:DNA (cytosine-5)-methyltransferase 1